MLDFISRHLKAIIIIFVVVTATVQLFEKASDYIVGFSYGVGDDSPPKVDICEGSIVYDKGKYIDSGIYRFKTITGLNMRVPKLEGSPKILGRKYIRDRKNCLVDYMYIRLIWDGDNWVGRHVYDGDMKKFRAETLRRKDFPRVSLNVFFRSGDGVPRQLTEKQKSDAVKLKYFPVIYYPHWYSPRSRHGYFSVAGFTDIYGSPMGFSCADHEAANAIKNNKVNEHRFNAKRGALCSGYVRIMFPENLSRGGGRMDFDTTLLPSIDRAIPKLIETVKNYVSEE